MEMPAGLPVAVSGRWAQRAISLLAAAAGFALPVLPFLRRGAFHCAGLVALLWAALLAIFFLRAAGVGFFGHLGLAALGVAAIVLPRRLDAIEARLTRLRRLVWARLRLLLR